MSTIHFIGGEKGGVGKSVLSRLVAQYFIDRSLSFAAIDADESHRALCRYYGDYTHPADLRTFASADQIMDRALGADRRVIVDLPAQSAHALARWIEESDMLRFAEQMSIGLVFWHVSDGGYASVRLLDAVVDLAEGNPGRHAVAVRNFGRSTDFAQFEESDERRRLLESGGHVMDLPALDAGVMYEVDRLGSSFWAAVHTTEGERALPPMQRRRAQLWLDQCYANLTELEPLL